MRIVLLLLLLSLLLVDTKCDAKVTNLKIISGDDASPDRYPYFVSVVDENFIHICGGTLITEDMVLSSAHCEIPDLAFALVGRYDTLDPFDDVEVVPITDQIRNPDWDEDTRENDSMLLVLAHSVDNTYYVKVNLEDNLDVDDDELTIIGFGRTNPDVYSPPQFLQELTVDYVSNQKCKKAKERGGFSYENMIFDDMMCLKGTQRGSGQCLGDSGGPVLLLDENNDDEDEDIQVAVMSWGRGCADAKFPSISARTSAASFFIRSTVCRTSSSAPDYLDCDNLPLEEVRFDSEDVSPGTLIPVIISIILPIATDDYFWSIMQGDRILFESPADPDKTSEIGRAVMLEYSQQYTFTLNNSEEYSWIDEIEYSLTAIHEGQSIVLLEGNGWADERPFEVLFDGSICIEPGGQCNSADTCCAGRCVRGFCRQTHRL